MFVWDVTGVSYFMSDRKLLYHCWNPSINRLHLYKEYGIIPYYLLKIYRVDAVMDNYYDTGMIQRFSGRPYCSSIHDGADGIRFERSSGFFLCTKD